MDPLADQIGRIVGALHSRLKDEHREVRERHGFRPTLGQEQRGDSVPDLVLPADLEAIQPDAVDTRRSRGLYDSNTHQLTLGHPTRFLSSVDASLEQEILRICIVGMPLADRTSRNVH
jgi:hypothetical protein